MNKKILFINDPYDEFGTLSPAYKYNMEIRREKTNNIISYCYAGLVNNGGSKNYILLSKPQEAMKLAYEKMEVERVELYNNSFMEGLVVKFKDPESKETLLKLSPEDISKIIEQKDHLKMILNFRNSLLLKDIEERNTKQKNEQIISKMNTIRIFEKLFEMYVFGKNNLEEYVGLSPKELLKKLNIFTTSIVDENVFKSYENILKHRLNIPHYIREKYYKDYNKNVIDNFKKDLLNSYVNQSIKNTLIKANKYYLTKSNKGNQINHKLIREIYLQYYDRLSDSEMNQLADRLYILYNNDLIKNIENLPEKPNLITLEKINEDTIIRIDTDEEVINGINIIPNSIKPSFNRMIEINGFLYPNLNMYVMVKMLSNLHTVFKNINIAYDYILRDVNSGDVNRRNVNSFKSEHELLKLYVESNELNISNILKDRAKFSLNYKFDLNPECAGNLVYTGNYDIIYDNIYDTILGSGKKEIDEDGNEYYSGQNFIGTYMMEIRDRLIHQGVKPEAPKLNINPLSSINSEFPDKDMLEWIQKKLADILYISYAFCNYLRYKYKNISVHNSKFFETGVIDEKIISFVVENFYMSGDCACIRLFNDFINSENNIEIASNFKYTIDVITSKMVVRDNGEGINVSKDGLYYLWSYIIYLKFLFKNHSGSEKFISYYKTLLNNFVDTRSEIFTPKILENNNKKKEQMENKTIYAFSNLFKILKKYNKNMMGYNTGNYKGDDLDYKIGYYIEDCDLIFCYEVISVSSNVPDLINLKDENFLKIKNYISNNKDKNSLSKDLLVKENISYISGIFNYLIYLMVSDKRNFDRILYYSNLCSVTV